MIERLGASEWQARREAHTKRVRPLLEDRLARASRHQKHPVEDFLFEYYSIRPAHLLRWSPGAGVVLEGASSEDFPDHRGFTGSDGGRMVAPLPPQRVPAFRWILSLLGATAGRTGFYGCHGLHEWAMVYRTSDIRHAAWPLRLPPAEIAAVVESLPVRCSHYDAFRFFTPDARPLNRLQPTRESTLDFEQPACLHANMDLYKWTGKLGPQAPSELLADTFELARDIRSLDMRASPYDLRALGYDAVAIETADGRAEYERAQREFARRAAPLREKLAAVCRKALSTIARPVLAGLAVVFVLSGCATTPLPEDAGPVVGLMSERLAVSKDVAWTKWANNLPIRDPERERRLLERVSNQAEIAGLDGPTTSRFVRTQIEASCLQQEYWMQTWRNGQGLPAGDPPTLDQLRVRLDSLTSRLVAEWAATEGTPIPTRAARDQLISEGASPAAASAAAAGLAIRPLSL
ncbi:MAG: gamma subclass chorismate mutase AroQ [Terrimicrobiaceae bacterium]|nr:gamma subclass chorismate mutase AroQ [Terrimicrobiaceae bacterium]